jgi:hypothetical protein
VRMDIEAIHDTPNPSVSNISMSRD